MHSNYAILAIIHAMYARQQLQPVPNVTLSLTELSIVMLALVMMATMMTHQINYVLCVVQGV